MNLIQIFNSIRDIPYKISLNPSQEEGSSCYEKHKKLFEILKKENYQIRYRICTFWWKDLNIPEELKQLEGQEISTHVYLELFLNNKWIKLDVTWDRGLENILPVNEWNGYSGTQIAINPIEIYSPEKSQEIMRETEETIVNSQGEQMMPSNSTDHKFCQAFNVWLETNRV